MNPRHFAMAPIVAHNRYGTPVCQASCLCGWRGGENPRHEAEAEARAHERLASLPEPIGHA